MNRTRYIFRGVFFLLTVLLLLYLNRKTGDNVGTIAEFEFGALEKIKTDSLDSKLKLDLLTNEATRFSGQIIEDSSHVREGIHYLIGLLGLFIVVESGFLIMGKRNSRQGSN